MAEIQESKSRVDRILEQLNHVDFGEIKNHVTVVRQLIEGVADYEIADRFLEDWAQHIIDSFRARLMELAASLLKLTPEKLHKQLTSVTDGIVKELQSALPEVIASYVRDRLSGAINPEELTGELKFFITEAGAEEMQQQIEKRNVSGKREISLVITNDNGDVLEGSLSPAPAAVKIFDEMIGIRLPYNDVDHRETQCDYGDDCDYFELPLSAIVRIEGIDSAQYFQNPSLASARL